MWLKEWKKDVKELETKVRAIKAKLRTDWRVTYKGVSAADDQFSLVLLKSDLTHLYQYRAANRKKVHAEAPERYQNYRTPDVSKYDKLKEASRALHADRMAQAESRRKDSLLDALNRQAVPQS